MTIPTDPVGALGPWGLGALGPWGLGALGHQPGFWQCLHTFSRCLPFISSEGSIEAAVTQKAWDAWDGGHQSIARDLPEGPEGDYTI